MFKTWLQVIHTASVGSFGTPLFTKDDPYQYIIAMNCNTSHVQRNYSIRTTPVGAILCVHPDISPWPLIRIGGRHRRIGQVHGLHIAASRQSNRTRHARSSSTGTNAGLYRSLHVHYLTVHRTSESVSRLLYVHPFLVCIITFFG